MKLAFITGSLEPGRSGVGDYVRRLAGACVERGHQVLMMAVNDPFVEASCATEGNPSSMRMAAGEFAANGMAFATRGLDAFAPDWISLQFVPYAYDPRGLLARRSGNLLRLTSGRALHVMCHELWVGEHDEAGLKLKLMGKVQKMMVRSFLRKAGPRVLHTGNGLYRALLGGLGFQSDVLPIFSTVADVGEGCRDWLLSRILENGSCTTAQVEGDKIWMTGIFGTLHNGVNYERILDGVIQAASETGRFPVCFSFGNLGQGEAIWQNLSTQYNGRIEFIMLGRQSAVRISEILNSIDLGISATPWDVTSKSSTVAAMLEHGLPVITSDDANRHRRKVPDESLNIPSGLKSVEAYLSEKLHYLPLKRKKIDGLTLVVEAFLRSLDGSQIAMPAERPVDCLAGEVSP